MNAWRTLIAVLIFLIAGNLPALDQSSDATFDQLHASLSRAAERELALVKERTELPLPLGEGGVRVSEFAEFQPSPGASARWLSRRPLPEGEGLNINPAFARLLPLLPMMRAIFDQEGVPREFILVGLVESGYRPDAISRANATGMWQFMPATARRFGLMNSGEDHRGDVIHSTRAAAQYLRALLDQFGDWQLALAAYNAGEDRVEEAIRRGGTRDFHDIAQRGLLPEETRNYVPSVLRAIAEARNLGVLR